MEQLEVDNWIFLSHKSSHQRQNEIQRNLFKTTIDFMAYHDFHDLQGDFGHFGSEFYENSVSAQQLGMDMS